METYAMTPTEYNGYWYIYHSNSHKARKLVRDKLRLIGIIVSIKDIERNTYQNKNGKNFAKIKKIEKQLSI